MIDDKLRDALGIAERKLAQVCASWARMAARATSEERATMLASTMKMRNELVELGEQIRPLPSAPEELVNLIDQLVARIDQLITSVQSRTLH